MEPDLISHDPEEKLHKFYALFSAGLGALSLCAGVIPAAGVILGLLAVGFGVFGRRSENKRLATAGIVLGTIGALTAFIYSLLLFFNL